MNRADRQKVIDNILDARHDLEILLTAIDETVNADKFEAPQVSNLSGSTDYALRAAATIRLATSAVFFDLMLEKQSAKPEVE